LDNLKVLLIAAIIAIHAILGYASWVEVWTYTELREVTLTPATQVVMFVLVSPFGFFLIALLFLVAGLLTGPSLERKGTARYLGTGCFASACRSSCTSCSCSPRWTTRWSIAWEAPTGRTGLST
jgi:hypothetical protein